MMVSKYHFEVEVDEVRQDSKPGQTHRTISGWLIFLYAFIIPLWLLVHFVGQVAS
jgi:hypothetical protein